MTIITPTGVSGITSITSSGDTLKFFKSNGSQLTTLDTNINSTGISTFSGGVSVSAGTAAAPSISPSGDPNTGVFFPSADTVAIAEGGVEALRVDSSGRLLVGTSSARSNFYNGNINPPQAQIEGTSLDAASLSLTVNANDATGPRVVLGKSRGTTIGSNTVTQADDQTGILSFQGNDGTEFVEAARITCQVDGTPGANDMPGRIVLATTADGASSPTERMRISNGGRIDTYSTASVALNVASSLAAGTSDIIYIGKHSGTGSPGTGTNAIFIYTNGNIQNINNSYGSLSDQKLKENIVDAASQWNDLKDLQIRKYNFKAETGNQTHTQIGLIAQEVELVSPGLVTESPDRDEEGNDLGTVTKSVNYSVLYMKAVKALQEAMERIEALEADVAALKSQ
jgi:hypothetical protein